MNRRKLTSFLFAILMVCGMITIATTRTYNGMPDFIAESSVPGNGNAGLTDKNNGGSGRVELFSNSNTDSEADNQSATNAGGERRTIATGPQRPKSNAASTSPTVAQVQHKMKLVHETSADCQHDGMVQHWYCEECHRYFATETDTGAGYETEVRFVKPQIAHQLVYIPETSSTCKFAGVHAHWYCQSCHCFFDNAQEAGAGHEDESYYNKPLAPHLMNRIPAIAASCQREGMGERWYCPVCGLYFDGTGTSANSYADDDVFILSRTPHALIHVDAVEPTTDSDGNIEYWVCKTCGKYFADENAVMEIEAQDIVPVKPEPVLGDIDGDGMLTEQDALALQDFLAEMVEETDPIYEVYLQRADFDGDGKVNVRDLTAIQRRLAGIE